jgi:hypothetical protein
MQSIIWRPWSSAPRPWREPWLPPRGSSPSRTTTEGRSLEPACERVNRFEEVGVLSGILEIEVDVEHPQVDSKHLRGVGPDVDSARGVVDGELGVLAPGSAADLVAWPLDGVQFAGALTDPVEAWLRCGPVSARHTVVNGQPVVRDGQLVNPELADILRRHRSASSTMQRFSCDRGRPTN